MSHSSAHQPKHSSRHQAPHAVPPRTHHTPGTSLARRNSTVAAFFDLDKTIIATSSAYVYGKEFLNSGLISPTTALYLSLAKASYMFTGHSSEQLDNTRDQLTSIIRGWDVAQISQIAREALSTTVTPTIYAEARELIQGHLTLGHDVIIVSASATVIIAPIAEELGVTTVIGTILSEKDGKFTGDIEFYCKGEAKAMALQRLAIERGYDLQQSYAYSDSITDLPMLEAVAHPVAVNPDRALRKYAQEHGFEIRSFRNPVPLITLPSSRDLTVGTGVVAGLAALTAAAMWWLKRPPTSA